MPCGTCCLKNSLISIARERALSSVFSSKLNLYAVLIGSNADAGAHGGGDGSALEVLALGSGGLSLGDGIQDGVQVGHQLLGAERGLADGHMDDVLLVQTVLDLTGLSVGNSLADVGGNGAGLGLGIRPRGPRTLPRRPTRPIMSGVVTTTSKSMKPPAILAISSSSPRCLHQQPQQRQLQDLAMAHTRTVLPVPLGRTTAPRTCWSA